MPRNLNEIVRSWIRLLYKFLHSLPRTRMSTICKKKSLCSGGRFLDIFGCRRTSKDWKSWLWCRQPQLLDSSPRCSWMTSGSSGTDKSINHRLNTVRSPKFIWAPVYSWVQCAHWLRPRNSPLPKHLGSYYIRGRILVSQDRRHLFVTPWRKCRKLSP